ARVEEVRGAQPVAMFKWHRLQVLVPGGVDQEVHRRFGGDKESRVGRVAVDRQQDARGIAGDFGGNGSILLQVRAVEPGDTTVWKPNAGAQEPGSGGLDPLLGGHLASRRT